MGNPVCQGLLGALPVPHTRRGRHRPSGFTTMGHGAAPPPPPRRGSALRAQTSRAGSSALRPAPPRREEAERGSPPASACARGLDQQPAQAQQGLEPALPGLSAARGMWPCPRAVVQP